ncbi:MAG: CDP-diacylglycerol--glycerol-3-phosphate 3-phosphatidyltransferase [Ezakiella sp.]|nr:CDP-diacylglycerol--glycerol-3-phosphate 3-phosphatidyltransferase [Ezakiella sp.]MDD7471910.1 CDP-diacylglycerol--glycerol-3-phosphate 3-phosphatidyltransferase [Bacillota bacterium]MDY3923874.1 CDP-diacylglycerol--glycerol-3-phosphate 3-phosphatidyltransferase [Ezakiella sp.]
MNVPNKLTLLRICLVPVFITLFYIYRETYISGIVFVIAAATDALDGYIARKYSQITTFGKFVDPLADKILVLSALTIFVEQSIISAVAVIIVIFREFTISGFRLIAAQKGITIAAGFWGKAKTAVQLIGIVIVLFSYNIPALNSMLKIGIYTIYISVALAIISLIVYINKNIGVLKETNE